ncbi:bifunctional serine/threonine-protein kinase/formylglycine-generating enzyme family protein [Pleurocapsa sp. PCC 7319]|uniref:bifunctional serine/threonine-protein kinase/formylglycine-generating enzyme family protein n=1 Tax=Pleurocapsa sp. PCC 7319 TaxID=118161 RepID=UPI00034D854B|nr:bifunctional serine/threonine-protein kinase/formylglycine-generating enzyme family protein [Pleurocapsa sp. PCC 7319]
MISQCLNPNCLHVNLENTELCEKCNSQLVLVDRYRAISLLGQGGFGRTFLAIDELKPSKPRCVVKQFLPEVKGKKALKKAAELFEREAMRLEELGKHKQIPELLAFFNQEDRQYLIQEFIDGNDLAKELAISGVFNQQQIKELLEDLLGVLKFVHENNVIHRDIKPENIIRRKKDGKLVLVDFGAAKEAVGADTSVVGTIIGSVAYIAPEQAVGKAKFASDLYSLGATCLHLLTNVEPTELFDTNEGEWMWRNYLQNNEIDYELSHVLDKLVEGATKRRFQSVEEVLQSLSAENTSALQTSSPKTVKSNYKHQKSHPKKRQKINQNGHKLKLKVVEYDFVTISDDPCLIVGKKFSLPTRRHSGKAKYITLDLGNDVTLDLIGIPGGKFLMGSPESESEREPEEAPQHLVSIRPFLLSKYPITQAQWQAIMGENPARFVNKDLPIAQSKKPVERVSWFDCCLFCDQLSALIGREFRLPTEAEWEYACRGKTQTPFHFGSTISTELANYNGEDAYGSGFVGENRHQTTDVDSFSANKFGLYDLHGNVAEWCADTWHDNYQNAPSDGSAWTSNNPKDDRVLRGGSWLHFPGSCRSAQRFQSSPKNKSDAFGFRIASSV